MDEINPLKMVIKCPVFLKCKEHDKYCFIKTGTTVNSQTYKQTFYVCAQTNHCAFQYPASISAVNCPEHPTEIVELQALYYFSSENVRYYFRCLIGKHQSKSKWCGFQVITENEVRENDIKAGCILSCHKGNTDETTLNPKPKITANPSAKASNHQQEVKKSESDKAGMALQGDALLINLQRDLETRKKLLSKVNLSSLPDHGRKLQLQIANIEQQISSIHLGGSVEATERKASTENKENMSASDKSKLPPKPLLNQFQELYADHPVHNQLYKGQINRDIKHEIVTVTREAVEKLHLSLENKPKATDELSDPISLTVPLMLHQRQALAWLLWRETQHPPGGILADDMGLGKTLTMIALILKDKEQHELKSASKEKLSSKVPGANKIFASTTLVICPASLLHHWESEVIERCSLGSIKVHIYHGPKRNCSASMLASFDMVITTYDIIRSEIPVEKDVNGDIAVYRPVGNSPLLKIGFHRIILDEGHIIRNPKTSTNQAVCCLGAGRRWVVSGTPIHNNLTDMFSLLKFLRCSPFDERKVWKYWVANGSAQGQARLATIVNTLLLRRTKEQQGTDGKPLIILPVKRVHDVYLILNKDERSIYDLLYEVGRTVFKNYLQENGHLMSPDNFANVTSIVPSNNLNVYGVTLSVDVAKKAGYAALLVLLLRLQQCCCHLHLLKHVIATNPTKAEDDIDDIVAEMSALNIGTKTANNSPLEDAASTTVAKQIIQECKFKLGPAFENSFLSSKLKALFAGLKELSKLDCSKGLVKSVVVSQWTSLLDIVAFHLDAEKVTYCSIRGDVPIPERSKAVAEFNSRTSGPQIMLLSLKAGGVGLNLIGGSNLFLLDVHWNPANESQAFDRIHRVGQIHNVHVHRFICKDTLEMKIVALQERKRTLSKNILEGHRTQKSKLTLNDLRMLFGV